jgi:hypothetical protein
LVKHELQGEGSLRLRLAGYPAELVMRELAYLDCVVGQFLRHFRHNVLSSAAAVRDGGRDRYPMLGPVLMARRARPRARSIVAAPEVSVDLVGLRLLAERSSDPARLRV